MESNQNTASDTLRGPVQVHYFDSTGEAYDACQCDDDIKNGDILIIQTEKVVGLAWAWPIAVTKNCGNLHFHKDGVDGIHQTKDFEGKYVFETSQVAEACRIAASMGYELYEDNWS